MCGSYKNTSVTSALVFEDSSAQSMSKSVEDDSEFVIDVTHGTPKYDLTSNDRDAGNTAISCPMPSSSTTNELFNGTSDSTSHVPISVRISLNGEVESSSSVAFTIVGQPHLSEAGPIRVVKGDNITIATTSIDKAFFTHAHDENMLCQFYHGEDLLESVPSIVDDELVLHCPVPYIDAFKPTEDVQSIKILGESPTHEIQALELVLYQISLRFNAY